jgi:hypothetical protein
LIYSVGCSTPLHQATLDTPSRLTVDSGWPRRRGGEATQRAACFTPPARWLLTAADLADFAVDVVIPRLGERGIGADALFELIARDVPHVPLEDN